MLKLIFILSLIPLLASLVVRKFLYRPLHSLEGKQAQLKTEKLFKELLPADYTLSIGKDLNVSAGEVSIPKRLAESKDLSDQVESLLSLGLILVSKGKNTGLKQHTSLLYFDTLFPSFGLMIVILGVLAKSIPIQVAIVLLVAILGVTALNNLYLTWLRKQAMGVIKHKLKDLPLYTKKEDQTPLEHELSSHIYKYSAPKVISWLLS